ncbi:hypothetical protein GCM10025777_39300 [Membranihabitans marinus]|uniref:Uncharacterized protein n=1 Tax=Nesterenkonia rhizosphaerae TaxID=1348272 RepID=A0ABP9G8M9_9MICC
MPLVQRWVAQCDHKTGCTAIIVHEPIPGGGKADYGEVTNDEGWAARPGATETYCPQHYPEGDSYS